jgi:hypothetical protein
MFGKYNGFVSKASVSACMYFLVILMSHYSSRFSCQGESAEALKFRLVCIAGRWLSFEVFVNMTPFQDFIKPDPAS